MLMESCLDPKWLKPWYRTVQQKMPCTSHLLQLSTPSAVALRLFALDRAILYDKVPAVVTGVYRPTGSMSDLTYCCSR